MRRRTLTLGLVVLATAAAFAAPRLGPALRPMAVEPRPELDADPIAEPLHGMDGIPFAIRPDVPEVPPPPRPQVPSWMLDSPPTTRPEVPRVLREPIPEVRHPVPVTRAPVPPRGDKPVSRPTTTIPELDAAPVRVVVPADPPRLPEWDPCPTCGMG